MAQFTGPAPDWLPIGNEFIDSAVSVGLKAPPIPSGYRGAYEYVAILTCQGTPNQFIRTDGVAAGNSVGTGIQMSQNDERIVEGLVNLRNVQVIRAASGGALAVQYFIKIPVHKA